MISADKMTSSGATQLATHIHAKVEKAHRDWCHACGDRDELHFFELWLPKNAEHSMEDTERGLVRICENCIGSASNMIAMQKAFDQA